MLKKSYGIFLIVFLIVVSSVIAGGYNQTGGYNTYFRNDLGFFNTELTDYDSVTRTITTQGLVPLVSDLDGDGVNEIIIWDDGSIRLFNNKTLSIVDSFSLVDSGRISNMISYDIDGDGKTELITALEEAEMLYVLEYNGTDFFNQSTIKLTDLAGSNDGEMVVQCAGVDKCLLVYTDQPTFAGAANHNISAVGFNSTDKKDRGKQIRATGSTTKVYCLPKIRAMAAADYDNDGNIEFIVDALEVVDGGTDDDLYVFYLSVDSTLTVTLEQTKTETRTGNLDDGLDGCIDQNMGKFFTPPLVYDIDGSSSNGLETVVGVNLDKDEFKMFSYKANGADLDDYPEVVYADGELISDVMLMDAFTDTGAVDFCVMGYQHTLNRIDLLCASEQTGNFYESEEFVLDVTNLYNVTSGYGNYNLISHAAQHSTATTEGNNLDEVVNSYGVLSLDWDNYCGSDGIITLYCLNLIFENPQIGSDGAGATLVSVDAENVGRADLILTTSTNLWYIDDLYINHGAVIDEYYVNPCVDSTWQINTSLEVRITPIDSDGDDVSARVILYSGDSNEQVTDWSANVSSGSTISFSDLQVNKTLSTAVMLLQAKDTGNPSEIDEIALTFSVGNSGVVFGDCTTDISGIIESTAPEETPANESQTPADENIVKEAIVEINAATGLGLIVIWLIIIVIIDFLMITEGKDLFKGWGSKYIFAVIAGVDILMIIIGAIFMIIPFWVVLLLILTGVIVGVLFIAGKIDKGG